MEIFSDEELLQIAMVLDEEMEEVEEQVYSPSPECLQLLGEINRKLKADDFTWDDASVLPLTDLAVQAINKNFENKPILDELPCEDRNYLLEILYLDLPLELVIQLIDDEFYWQRRYTEHFGLITNRKPESWSWKSLYLSRHVQKIIEEAQPQYSDEENMDEILDLCAPFTQRLFVTQLQSWKPPLTMEKEDIPEVYPIDHINMIFVLRKLPQITEFSISYGMNEVGEDFNWGMFKVSVTDCVRLGKALLELKQIKILRIHRSNIEYKHCQALMQSLIRNRTLVELDLSNCNIGNQGALCVAKVISTHPTLKKLNLTNNRVGQIGAEGICYALTLDTCARLDELNLRLNPLCHEGVMGVLRALIRCNIPRELIMSGCNFEEETPWKLCQMIKHNIYLEGLDISNNWFGSDGGEFLCESMEENKTLRWLDVRETDITPAQLQTIKKFLKRNVTGVMTEDEESQSQRLQKQEPSAEEKVIAETIYKAEDATEEKEAKDENE